MFPTVDPSLYTPSLTVDLSEICLVSVVRFACGQESTSYPDQSYFKLVFIEDGEGSCFIDSELIGVAAGTLVLIAPGKRHHLSGLKMTKRWVAVFAIDTLFLGLASAETWLKQPDELVWLLLLRPNDAGTRYFQVAPEQRSKWLERLHQLDIELQERLPGFMRAACALLWLLLIDTGRLAVSQEEKSALQLKPLLKDVFQFIETYYFHQISLFDVAKAVNLTSGYLTTFIRRETGRTVLSWIIEWRMIKARRLLLTTEQSVQLVAEAVGYTDPGHFIRQFRQRYGNTPQAWRRACLSRNAFDRARNRDEF
ncbi:MAG: AraC family transcriptional regulator [Rhizonema sp. NSF051]|nr:AraC family transcriptional regulator [Rhizonema sp. NSF051]